MSLTVELINDIKNNGIISYAMQNGHCACVKIVNNM